MTSDEIEKSFLTTLGELRAHEANLGADNADVEYYRRLIAAGAISALLSAAAWEAVCSGDLSDAQEFVDKFEVQVKYFVVAVAEIRLQIYSKGLSALAATAPKDSN